MRAVRTSDRQVAVVDVPAPAGHGVLVRIASAGICGSDLHMVDSMRLRATLGHEFAGFLPDGRLVAVEPLAACRVCGPCSDGGMAEACLVPEATIVPLAAGVAPADASLVEPLAVAVHAVRLAGPLRDAEVAVVGGGSIGLCLVPALQAAGATHVDVVARHEHQRAATARLGAASAEPEASRWDLVFDAVGTAESLAQCVDMVRPAGRVVLVGVYWDGTVPMPGMAVCFKEVRLLPSMMYGSDGVVRDFDLAARLLADRPELGPTLITHRFPLDAAAEAFACARDRSAGAIKVVLQP